MIDGDLVLASKVALVMWFVGALLGIYFMRTSHIPQTFSQKFLRVVRFASWISLIGFVLAFLDNGNSSSSCKEWGRYASNC